MLAELILPLPQMFIMWPAEAQNQQNLAQRRTYANVDPKAGQRHLDTSHNLSRDIQSLEDLYELSKMWKFFQEVLNGRYLSFKAEGKDYVVIRKYQMLTMSLCFNSVLIGKKCLHSFRTFAYFYLQPSFDRHQEV